MLSPMYLLSFSKKIFVSSSVRGLILSEKDKKLEEKNQVIFALQHKVAELETKLKNTVALPLYQQEKEELILEKENLKIENKVLEEKLKKEKLITYSFGSPVLMLPPKK